MNLKIVKKGDLKYIECLPGNERISVNQGKFKEWVMETNRGNEFQVFSERDKAEEWLIRD